MISFKCPYCGHEYNMPDEHAGRTYPCKSCQKPITVPEPMPVLEEDITSRGPGKAEPRATPAESGRPNLPDAREPRHNNVPYAPAPQGTSGLAVASLIFGILAYLCMPFILTLPAIITGHIALSQIKKSRGALTGTALAIIGMVLGYLNLALVLFVVVMIVGGLMSLSAIPIIGSLLANKTSPPASHSSPAQNVQVPAREAGENDIAGTLLFYTGDDGATQPARVENVYVLPQKIFQKFRQDLEMKRKNIAGDILREEGRIIEEKNSEKQNLEKSLEDVMKEIETAKSQIQGYINQIEVYGKPEEIQKKRDELAGKLGEIQKEYTEFQDPRWTNFRVDSMGEPTTINTTQRAAFDRRFQAAIAGTQKEIEAVDQTIQAIQPIMQKMEEPSKRLDLLSADTIRLENSIKGLDEEIAGLSSRRDESIIAANRKFHEEMKSELDQMKDVLRVQTDLEGKFVFPKKKGEYTLFALHLTEAPECRICSWEYTARPEEKVIILDQKQLRQDLSITLEMLSEESAVPTPDPQ